MHHVVVCSAYLSLVPAPAGELVYQLEPRLFLVVYVLLELDCVGGDPEPEEDGWHGRQRSGDGYVIKGSKTFISNGFLAGVVLVVAKFK